MMNLSISSGSFLSGGKMLQSIFPSLTERKRSCGTYSTGMTQLKLIFIRPLSTTALQRRSTPAALYGTKRFDNGGELVAGLSWALSRVRHDSLEFRRNLLDQDGEAFDPWYADGNTHELNLSVQYNQVLLPWLRVHVEGFNSFLHFSPSTASWRNEVYAQSIADKSPISLYQYQWTSAAFGAGLLENEALVIAEKELARGLRMQAHVGVSLDGILLDGKSVVTPNWLAKFSLNWHPCWWFQMEVGLSHNRMSYTLDEVKYLSKDYMNGEIRYADGTLLATTG